MKKNKFIKYLPILMLLIHNARAQNMGDLLAESEQNQVEWTTATFKGTKVLNTHSIETLGKGVLQVNFQHRFGSLENNFYDFLG